MMILDYTLSSLNKNIVFDVPNKFYNAEECVDIIKEVLRCLDHSLRKDN